MWVSHSNYTVIVVGDKFITSTLKPIQNVKVVENYMQPMPMHPLFVPPIEYSDFNAAKQYNKDVEKTVQKQILDNMMYIDPLNIHQGISLMAKVLILLVIFVVGYLLFKLYSFYRRHGKTKLTRSRQTVFGLRKRPSEKDDLIEMRSIGSPTVDKSSIEELIRPEPSAPPDHGVKYIYSVGAVTPVVRS